MNLLIIGLCVGLCVTCTYSAPAENKTESTTKSVLDVPQQANELTKGAAQKVNVAKKREIPDALVDHPEDFDESDEEMNRDGYRPSVDDGSASVVETSRLDEDNNEYPYYGSIDGRRKRTAAVMLGRAKRDLEINPAQLEQLLLLLGKGPVYNFHQRQPEGWTSESQNDYDSSESNNLEDSPEYVEPLQDQDWPRDIRNRVYPIHRFSVPVYQRNAF